MLNRFPGHVSCSEVGHENKDTFRLIYYILISPAKDGPGSGKKRLSEHSLRLPLNATM